MERAWVRQLMCLHQVFEGCDRCKCSTCGADICMLAHKYKDEWAPEEIPCVEPAAAHYELNFMKMTECENYVQILAAQKMIEQPDPEDEWPGLEDEL